MMPNISSVFLSTFCLWITLCGCVSTQDGSYVNRLKRDHLDLVNLKRIVLSSQGGHHKSRDNGQTFESEKVNDGSRSEIKFHGVYGMGFQKDDKDHYVKNSNLKLGFKSDALKKSPQLTHEETRGDLLPEHGVTNKALVMRSRLGSISPLHRTRATGPENVNDLIFLYSGDSLRDTYRIRYQGREAENSFGLLESSPADKKSFDSVSSHYGRRDSESLGSIVNSKSSQLQHQTGYDNNVPQLHMSNLDPLSRLKRQAESGVNPSLSTSHSDQSSWPDRTDRLSNKITSPPLINGNSIRDPINNVPEPLTSTVKDTVPGPPLGMGVKESTPAISHATSSNEAPSTSSNTDAYLSTEPTQSNTKPSTTPVLKFVHIPTTSSTTKQTPEQSPAEPTTLPELTTKSLVRPSLKPLLRTTTEHVTKTTPIPQPEPTSFLTSQVSETMAEPTTKPVPDPTTEPLRKQPTKTKRESTSKPSPEPLTKPEPTTEPLPEPTTQSTPEPTTKPVPEQTTKSTLKSTTKSKPEPTTKPTPELTTKPTPEPTTEPTPEPTTKPVPEPTTKPTPEPTTKPTPEPTPEPTTEPTPEPTTKPVPEPTTKPTPEPTTMPTPEPTTKPTPEPTTKPTLKPTTKPTPEPTPEPTTEPTTEPTPEPTTKPTSEPTTKPTPEPTPELSTKPTTKPTPEPTTKPTPEPTTKPPPKPTTKPTLEPSTKPTPEPTPEPTTTPTPEPTTKPTPEPTTKILHEPPTIPLPEPTTVPVSEPTTTGIDTSLADPEPETTPEPSSRRRTFVPVILIPEEAESMEDEITKILDDVNNTLTSQDVPSTTSESASSDNLTASSESTPEDSTTSEPAPTPVSETGPSSTTEPKSEPDTPEPEDGSPEPEDGSPEPEKGTPEPPAETTPIAVAEPGPDWEDAKKKWSIAWPVHLYMLGSIFAAIAVYTLMSMIKLYQINRLLSKKYFVTLNLLIFTLCTLRATFLLVDGYNANNTFHPVVNYLLYSTAFPCLTSAFSILLYALLQATQMRLVPPRVQKIQILIVVIFLHFCLQMTTDVVVGTYAGMAIMLFVCQLVFICWGLFLFIGYAYIFRYLYSSAVKRQKNYQYMLTGKLYPSSGESYKHKFTLSLAVKVTFMAAIFGLVTIGLEIYAIVGVYGVFSDKKPDPWPWWLYHTALRLIECLMCITMAYVASQPFRYRERESCGLMCAPCLEICKCEGPGDQSDKLGWSEYDRLYMTTNKRTNGHINGKKKKIYLNEGTDIVPIVIQPSTTEESRPPSMLIIEDGYVRFQAETDINKIVDNYSKQNGQTEMTTFRNDDGIVNCAYIRSMEDTVRFQTDVASSGGFTRKSRKSSLASSGFFRPPSSISLADSMESEIDKAFQSMRQDSRLHASSHSLPSRSTYSIEDNFQGPAIEAFIEQSAGQTGVNLRRSRSALGDLNIHRPDSWRQKLFRSRSDSSGGVRTKDVDSMRYLSLLDLEKQQDKNVSFASASAISKDSDTNSVDSFQDNQQSTGTQQNGDLAKRLLKKEISEPEEIDV